MNNKSWGTKIFYKCQGDKLLVGTKNDISGRLILELICKTLST